ncbi:MAG: murein biosynthesis integral membrane protein MurJ [Formosimonas sp.]
MNLLKTLASVGGITLLSRIAGLAREVLTARIFGAGAATDAFFIAFRIPNLLRRLFAEGAFSQAFVPILAHSKNVDGMDRTKVLVDRVATVLFWVVSMVSILGIVGVNVVLWVMTFGAVNSPDATLMTQIMFPYILFMSLAALSGGVLNTWKNFSTPAFTPVLLNLILIASALWLSPYFNPPILALAIGVFVGGLLQLAWQLPALYKIGMLPRISFNLRAALADDGVRSVLKKMLPATLAVSVAQLSLVINTALASNLGVGAVSWISYADRLMEFPTAILGVGLGTILMPSLARAHSLSDTVEYNKLLNWGLRLTFLLALPAAVGLGVLAEPLTSALYQSERFDALATQKTAQALSMYAIGLIGLISVKILASAYYAKQDIKTPVKIALFVLVMTQVMNQIFIPFLGHAGLSLSIGLGACLNAGILAFLLTRRGVFVRGGWLVFFAKLIVASVVLGAVAYGLAQQVDWLHAASTHKLLRVLELLGIIAASALAYFVVLFALGFRVRDFRLIAQG